MRADMGDLTVLLVIGVIAVIGTLVRAYRGAKARNERLRQLHPRPEQEPLSSVPKPETSSPLEQFRQFMEQVQAESRQRQPMAGPAPTQQVVRRVKKVVQPPQPSRLKPEEELKAQAGRGKLSEQFAQGDAKAAVPREEPKEAVSPLAAIAGSERSELEKAVLLSEILGRPVSLRRPVVPRFRS